MAFQPALNTVQCIAKHTGQTLLTGCEAQWSLYFELLAAPSQADVNAIHAAFTAQLAGGYSGHLSVHWKITESVTQSLHTEGGPQASTINVADGILAGDPVPPSVALLFQYRAGSGGSSFRGRAFLPLGAEGDLVGDEYASVFTSGVLSTMNSLIAACEAAVAGAQHCVVSRYSGFTEVLRKKATRRTPNALVTNVAQTSVRSIIASQRNRRP